MSPALSFDPIAAARRAELEALSETLRRVRIDAGDFEDGLSRSNAG